MSECMQHNHCQQQHRQGSPGLLVRHSTCITCKGPEARRSLCGSRSQDADSVLLALLPKALIRRAISEGESANAIFLTSLHTSTAPTRQHTTHRTGHNSVTVMTNAGVQLSEAYNTDRWAVTSFS